ncbi:hypothetical protein [Actinophytocola glycyrrhizae]|uniref:DUF4352 domain-containing protein n=1 Tax=Actinophytocola glycyrrhizae TaxID=2044873 RepID=A0ABV9S8E2_9PSEU
MPVVRLAVAACVLLVLTACGAGHAADDDGSVRQSLTTPDPTVAAERSDLASGGLVRSLAEGITLTVSAPTSFTPTDTAYPRAARAVAFELLIENGSDTVYRPAQMSFVATADGAAAVQVVDSTQGYTGVVGAIDEVPPSDTLRFAVAFGVPSKPCVVRVAVRPASSAASAIPIFDGTV